MDLVDPLPGLPNRYRSARGTATFFCLLLFALVSCGRGRSPSPVAGQGWLADAIPVQTPRVVATWTPTPTVATATPTPTATPKPPPFPTPEVDLEDLSVYQASLKPEFAGDVYLVPDAPRYFIQAVLIPGDMPAIVGLQRVRYTNNEQVALDTLYFRLFPNLPGYGGTMAVERVILDNELVTVTLEAEGTALRVPLDPPLAPGAVADLTLWFNATIPTSVIPGSAGAGIFGYVRGVYDLAGFYPTIPVYDTRGWHLDVTVPFGDSPFTNAAFHQVQLTVPTDLTVVASGTTVDRWDNGDGTHTWSMVAGPMRAFYAAASSLYDVVSRQVNGAQVNSYFRRSQDEAGQIALYYASESLAVFEGLFAPYPYSELNVLAMPTTGYGMEHPGVINLAQSFYDGSGGSFGVATIHEVAHQWWYNIVGNDQPNDPWLDESLTNYCVYLYYDAVGWEEMRVSVLEDVFRWRYLATRQAGIDRPVAGPVSSFTQSNYVDMVYSKGPLFFHAVRERLGDDGFFRGLRAYLATHRYGVAYPEDLVAAFESVSGESIGDLYDFWILGKAG